MSSVKVAEVGLKTGKGMDKNEEAAATTTTTAAVNNSDSGG
ncbi:MAG: hypothetical protein ACREBR_03190 [bacterium]